MANEPNDAHPPGWEQRGALDPLKMVRAWLIACGLLLVLVHGLEVLKAREVMEQKLKDAAVTPAQVDRGLLRIRMTAGLAVALGAIYVAAGITIKAHPVPVTVFCLAAFLLFQVVIATINPIALRSYVLFKVIVVFGLAMAIRAASRHQA